MARTYLQQQHKTTVYCFTTTNITKSSFNVYLCALCCALRQKKKTKHQQKIARISELTENVYFNTARTGKKKNHFSPKHIQFPTRQLCISRQGLVTIWELTKRKKKKQTVAAFLFYAHHTKSKQSNFKFALGRQGLTPGRPTAKRLPQR